MSPSSRPLLAALTFAGALPVFAGSTANVNVLSFSDPTRPGTLRVHLGRGDLVVTGADTREVSIKTDTTAAPAKPRKDGLRVISAAASYSCKESDNVVTLDATAQESGRTQSSFQITVPRSTTVVVQNAWGGDIVCREIDGDIEVNSMHGQIRLESISGGAVIGTMNGEINASMRALQEGKPLSFTSMNGEVVLRVPADAKASVRLRTQNGAVLTDFDESALVTKSETVSGFSRTHPMASLREGKVLTMEVQNAIREATQLSATAIREALEAVRDGLEAAKLDSDQARRQLEAARREMERSRRDREVESRSIEERRRETGASTESSLAPAKPATPRTPVPPKPPKAPLPTITGGKLVTGTLNGGGPEISIATMNGDVILRKIESPR